MHVGSVGDQNGTLHQGVAGLGVFQFREFVQNVGHFVAALAAADIDYDIRFRPFCQLVLYYGFAGAERSRYGRNAAFGDGEQGVDDALSGDQGHIRRKFFFIGAAFTDRPALHQSQS